MVSREIKKARYDQLISEGKSSTEALLQTDREFGEGYDTKPEPITDPAEYNRMLEKAGEKSRYIKTFGRKTGTIFEPSPQQIAKMQAEKEKREAIEKRLEEARISGEVEREYYRAFSGGKSEARERRREEKHQLAMRRGNTKARSMNISGKTTIRRPINIGSLPKPRPMEMMTRDTMGMHEAFSPGIDPVGNIGFGNVGDPVGNIFSFSQEKKKKKPRKTVSGDPLGLRGYF